MKHGDTNCKKKISPESALKKAIHAVVFAGFLAVCIFFFLQAKPFSRTSDGSELLLGQNLDQVSKALDLRTAEYSKNGELSEYMLIMPGYRQTMCFRENSCVELKWEYWEFPQALDRVRELDSVLCAQYQSASENDTLTEYLAETTDLSPTILETYLEKSWYLPSEEFTGKEPTQTEQTLLTLSVENTGEESYMIHFGFSQ